jgi:hypothetical protein
MSFCDELKGGRPEGIAMVKDSPTVDGNQNNGSCDGGYVYEAADESSSFA